MAIQNDSRRSQIGLVVALLLVTAGCSLAAEKNALPASVEAALEKPDRLILYSLNPDPRHAPKDEKSDDNFHGYLVLGSTEIEKRSEQKKLVSALERGIAASDGTAAACFNPLHGIRVQVGDKTFDLVICFECLSASIYENGQRREGVLLTASPQPTFNAVLKAAGVRLPKQAE